MRICLPFLLLLVATASSAQEKKPEDVLNNWSSRSPIEKIYLHMDRENYLAGETAWFKAYLYSDYQPDTISTVLYVELLNAQSAVLSRKILPVFLGTSYGQLELPDTLKSGNYVIRSYTTTMMNQDASLVDKRAVYIFGKKAESAPASGSSATRVEFFPEGGNLVTGFLNTIAFKATNADGVPVEMTGVLKNDKNETITSLTSYHDGMGLFELTPAANEKYYVELTGTPAGKKYYLPDQSAKGIAISIIPHPQGHFFELKQNKNDPDQVAAYMIGQMQHHVVFRQNFNTTKEEVEGVINTQNLMSGILQITFFNKNGIPLAERLCFVNNKEYLQPAELIADSLNFNDRARNKFSIAMKDTVQGSLSVSVTDPAFDISPTLTDNIVSHLLMTADLKGYVHNPAWYFSAETDSVKTALDLVMMTNGWRRYKWTDLLSKPSPLSNYKDPAYITLAGRVNIRDTRKPFAEKDLLLLLVGADSTRSMQMIHTDQNGEFKLDSLLFYGKTRVMVSDIRGKRNQFIDVKMSGDSITRSFYLPGAEPSYFGERSIPSENATTAMGYDLDEIQKAAGTMLEGITLKVKKKNPVQELEEKYASGMFSGFSERTIDLVNTDEVVYQNNIFDYLQLKVPGLTISQDGLDYSVFYRQVASPSSMGAIPMTLYLNEVETDATFISTIPANQIAMVKVFNSFAGAAGNAPGGVLAIYTKKGSDLDNVVTTAADLFSYRGFSVIKEFYAPDYQVKKPDDYKADHRITLDWRPVVFVNSVNPHIPITFYNNDRTRQYHIVVQGMTVAGKMIYLEKTVGTAPKGF